MLTFSQAKLVFDVSAGSPAPRTQCAQDKVNDSLAGEGRTEISVTFQAEEALQATLQCHCSNFNNSCERFFAFHANVRRHRLKRDLHGTGTEANPPDLLHLKKKKLLKKDSEPQI